MAQVTEPVIKCSICKIAIGPGLLEQKAYPSRRGEVCSQCARENPIRIDTSEKGWRKGLR